MLLQICALFVILVLFVLANEDVREYIRTQILLLKLPSARNKSWLTRIPCIGITFKLAFVKPEELLFLFQWMLTDDPVVVTWVAGRSFAVIQDVSEMERVLGSSTHITKGTQYDTVKTWLQEGLLTSSGSKWHQRRKLLTPAFHFKILEDCLPIMNRNAKILSNKMFELCKAPPTTPLPLINLCTLDVISEAAMGVKLNAQQNEASDYVANISIVSEMIVRREMYFWLRPDFIFDRLPCGKKFYKALGSLHKFTEKIIADRKEMYTKEKAAGIIKDSKRKAFLDCLIDVEMQNPGTLSDLDMREEVDTFMFEGHDTTSMALVHALMLLGVPDFSYAQDKLADELYEVFGDSDRDVTYKDLQSLTYLENVIKEVLRLCPSVPLFTRLLTSDLQMKCGLVIPRGTNIFMSPFIFHLNSNTYPESLAFRPERFAGGNHDRNPYAYVPFSAGPRNCIGQKFAMMELKTVLSTVLRKVKVETLTGFDKVQFTPFLILRTKDPLKMRFTPRVFN